MILINRKTINPFKDFISFSDTFIPFVSVPLGYSGKKPTSLAN